MQWDSWIIAKKSWRVKKVGFLSHTKCTHKRNITITILKEKLLFCLWMKEYNIAQTFIHKIIASFLLIGKEKGLCIFAYFIHTKWKRSVHFVNTRKVNKFIYRGKLSPSIESLNFLLFLAGFETYDIYLIFEHHVSYI